MLKNMDGKIKEEDEKTEKKEQQDGICEQITYKKSKKGPARTIKCSEAGHIYM